jgi:membrane protease YdiL (CAAX protease family)
VFLTNYLDSFWIRVTLGSVLLAIFANIFGEDSFKDDLDINPGIILKGVIAGLILYTAFYIGYNLLESILYYGANSVYLFRTKKSLYVSFVTLFITSFCEEYFWRRYTQTILIRNYGFTIGLSLTTIFYGLIHLPTFNLPLVFAAFISGFYWGVLYEYTGSLWITIISHIVWTELIFVFLPLI